LFTNQALTSLFFFEGQLYQERFEQKYGFFRPYVRQVIYRYPWPRPGLLFQLQGTPSLNNEPKP
jgi:hypothetical protein